MSTRNFADVLRSQIAAEPALGALVDDAAFESHIATEIYNARIEAGLTQQELASLAGTSQLSYRYYTDSFGIAAHTLELEYVQRLPHAWTLTPILRLYSQSAADFYVDPVNPPFPAIRPRDQLQSQDQRLSRFGALTYGLKLSKEITPEWRVDAQLERYEQRSDWYQTGSGSPGIEPFRATMMQFGVSYSF